MTGALGVVKWITIGLYLLAGVVMFAAVSKSAETVTDRVVLLEVAVVVAGLAGAAITWAVFGWLQGVLGCLVVMATPPESLVLPTYGGPATPGP